VSAVETVAVVIFLYYLIVPSVERITGKIGTDAILVSAVACYGLLSWAISFVNTRLMRALDALFFRDVYSAEKILTDLAQSIGTINEQSELLKLVAGELMRALKVERVAFFLPEQKRWSGVNANKKNGAAHSNVAAAYWLAYARDGGVELQFESGENRAGLAQLFELVYRGEAPVEIDYEDRGSFVYRLGEDERALLAEVSASVIIPLKEGARMAGMMSLSAKLSELPYTSDDIRLLETVAAQISVALERVWLLREVAQQERLRREMEIASMVQRKLFPEAMSDTPALEIVGICHPARSVGGDYYDFIRIGPDKLGIAIGDVSGKGISAALIMSTLQASLRSMASVPQYEVVDVVSIVNRLLCASTDADKFATFFYGVYDESANTLTYVNAGHDPPFLLHCISTPDLAERPLWPDVEIKRPDRGGMVLGVQDGCDYEQATIKLHRGDALVGYTDGLTEAVNAKGEMYGEERIKDLVGQNFHLPARALHQLILDNVRQFMGEMDQRDDLTVIVAKVR
jgi:sigma-B regulation protein RsbU (phosphoserine phosphatase)